MKVLHIAECAGGVERYLAMLLPLLKEKGVVQVLACSHDYDTEKFRSLVDEVRQMNLRQSFSARAIFTQVKRLRAVIGEVRPDVVYCHSSFAGGLGRLAVRMSSDVKVVYNPHGWAFDMGAALSDSEEVCPSKKQLLYLRIERMLARWTDRIVCISKAERESAFQVLDIAVFYFICYYGSAFCVTYFTYVRKAMKNTKIYQNKFLEILNQ